MIVAQGKAQRCPGYASHSIALSTQGPSATVTAQSGVGATAGSGTHTHNTNFASQANDTKPLYYNVVWIMRIK